MIGNHRILCTRNKEIGQTDWSDCDVVIEASGKMKTKALLNAYLAQGVKRVVVTAPVKEEGVLNVVMGVNHHLYDKAQHPIVTAASCTTNCLAPVVKVIHEQLGIKHGSMTTIHDITNTQTILDAPMLTCAVPAPAAWSLIPTTTGSATAITHIFPELKGKLNGHAVRVPLANASLTDCVFEVNRPTTEAEVNDLLKAAAMSELKGIMGYEERPLVSVDYKTDPRSCTIDALSTMVVNDTQVKIYAWYDSGVGLCQPHRRADAHGRSNGQGARIPAMELTRLSRDPPVSAGDRQLLGLHLTDGALRMLVVLCFHGLGYSPLAIASPVSLYGSSGW